MKRPAGLQRGELAPSSPLARVDRTRYAARQFAGEVHVTTARILRPPLSSPLHLPKLRPGKSRGPMVEAPIVAADWTERASARELGERRRRLRAEYHGRFVEAVALDDGLRRNADVRAEAALKRGCVEVARAGDVGDAQDRAIDDVRSTRSRMRSRRSDGVVRSGVSSASVSATFSSGTRATSIARAQDRADVPRTCSSGTTRSVMLSIDAPRSAWNIAFPGLPEIRTCRFPASGSSRQGFATRCGRRTAPAAGIASGAEPSPPRRDHAASGDATIATTPSWPDEAVSRASLDCPYGRSSRSGLVADCCNGVPCTAGDVSTTFVSPWDLAD
jgi:hypothetical protein